ncbi:NAD(P)/FAD-dependent oxidoreductase [Mesorhizobium sp. M0199]|uniref:phytoene desaturase family protein n=1 Tax=unclassified Mesorhizobium TaxID=325217 RepID=UPI003339F602
MEGVAGTAAALRRHPEAVLVTPAARSRRHVARQHGSARPNRTGAEEAWQGGHARFPARAVDERCRPARRAACRRPAEGPACLRRYARQPSWPALADLAARSLLPPGRRDRRFRGAQMLPKGGMGAVIAAIRASAQQAGVTIRTATPVAKIIVEKGRAVGVLLDSGEEIRATTVVSAINPATTMVDLVGPREVDTGFVRKVGNIRMKGDAAKLNLALDQPPQFVGVDAAGHRGRLVIAPSTDHVERAFNPSKYGEFSPEPVMEITLPSLSDASLAPEGACVLSAVVQYAPYALKEGWGVGKPKFLKVLMAELEAYAPGIGGSVLHADLLTPADIEARYRMPGGHWHHGELQADQMLMSTADLRLVRLRHAGGRAVPCRRRLASGRRALRRAGPECRKAHHYGEGVAVMVQRAKTVLHGERTP